MSRAAIFLSGTGSYDPGDILFTQDLDEVSTTTYIGKSKKNGTWQLTKMDEANGDQAIVYASVNNNPTMTTYALAWTNHLTLVYGDITTT